MPQIRVMLIKDEGGYLAQGFDNHAIIVTGKNKQTVRKNLAKLINGHVEAFPSTKNEFFEDGKLMEIKLIDVKLD